MALGNATLLSVSMHIGTSLDDSGSASVADHCCWLLTTAMSCTLSSLDLDPALSVFLSIHVVRRLSPSSGRLSLLLLIRTSFDPIFLFHAELS